MRDTILRSDFLPKTVQGIRRYLEDHDGYDERLSGPIETWALLFFELRQAEDRTEWFPSGKWATIQRLEELLNEATNKHIGLSI